MFNLPSANLNRRRLLLGLASATGAAVVGSGVAVGAAVTTSTEGKAAEGETLLGLADQLADAVAEIKAANAAYWKMVRAWEPKWPSAPAAITLTGNAWIAAEEKGFDGRSIMPDGSYYQLPAGDAWNKPHPKPRHVRKASDYATIVRSLDAHMKRRRPKHPLTVAQLMECEAERAEALNLKALAAGYEARCSEIRTLSNYEGTKERRYAALEAAHEVIRKIMAEKPLTMAGVLIQAEALEAGKLTEHHHMLGAFEWASAFATTLLSLAREAASQQA